MDFLVGILFFEISKIIIEIKLGYRRNIPSLRRQPTIGIGTIGTESIVPFGRFSVVGCGKPYAFHCRCKFDQPCRCHNQNKLCRCVKT